MSKRLTLADLNEDVRLIIAAHAGNVAPLELVSPTWLTTYRKLDNYKQLVLDRLDAISKKGPHIVICRDTVNIIRRDTLTITNIIPPPFFAEWVNTRGFDLVMRRMSAPIDLSASGVKVLMMDECNYPSLFPLPTTLTVLYADRTNISNIDALAPCTLIDELRLSHNHIIELAPLTNKVNLQVLDLSNNKIVKVDTLSGLPALVSLEISSNKIINIVPLAALPRLNSLQANRNLIRVVPDLQVRNLEICSNPIETVSLLNVTNIWYSKRDKDKFKNKLSAMCVIHEW